MGWYNRKIDFLSQNTYYTHQIKCTCVSIYTFLINSLCLIWMGFECRKRCKIC